MPIATRTFRVFVSSTFEDLKAERDALQRDVFPEAANAVRAAWRPLPGHRLALGRAR